jgi:hypothetical protein
VLNYKIITFSGRQSSENKGGRTDMYTLQNLIRYCAGQSKKIGGHITLYEGNLIIYFQQ